MSVPTVSAEATIGICHHLLGSSFTSFAMDSLKKIAIAVLVLSFFVFIALFGRLPALRYEIDLDTM